MACDNCNCPKCSGKDDLSPDIPTLDPVGSFYQPYNNTYGMPTYNPYGQGMGMPGYDMNGQEPYNMDRLNKMQEQLDSRLDSEQVEEIWDGRRRLAWLALISMIIPTFYIIGFVALPTLVAEFGSLLTWFYLSMASVVCAYFGFSSWASIKGK